MRDLGVIIIGRDEGERLRRCLESVVGRAPVIVYVDSGSTDDSVGLARGLGADVVDLDTSAPFTAARARNAGIARLREIAPGVRFVQFVDGDCEVVDGWPDRARDFLESRPEVAAVCGRLRERFPERSAYNKLADLEWDAPAGEVRACGGIALMRAAALPAEDPFNPALMAGEEPDLCLRLRRAGWTIWRLDVDMALHDMAMTRLEQWWRRCVRIGYGYAEGAALHGRAPERHYVRESRSVLLWGLLVPLLAAGLAWPTRGMGLGLLAGYPLLDLRIALRARRRGRSWGDAALYAHHCVASKFPMAVGLIRYRLARAIGRRNALIEYKGRHSAPERMDVPS